MNIILIGYRGTGKTTVARHLAEHFGWPAIDADDSIETLAKKSIKEIFAEDGEQVFRDYESQVVADLCARQGQILAMGGGAILRERNRDTMRDSGAVVWLTADPATLLSRIAEDPITTARRPNLTACGGLEEIQTLLTARQPAYKATSHQEVDTTDKTPKEIAQLIAEIVTPDCK